MLLHILGYGFIIVFTIAMLGAIFDLGNGWVLVTIFSGLGLLYINYKQMQ